MPIFANSRHPWYVMTVNYHHEKAVSEALEGRGLDHYLPLYRSFHRHSGRMQEVWLPAFPGYIFCSFDISNRLPVLTIPSVGSIVCIGRAPATIHESDLSDVDRMICSDLNVAPHPVVWAGRHVYIDRGPCKESRACCLGTDRTVVLSSRFPCCSAPSRLRSTWIGYGLSAPQITQPDRASKNILKYKGADKVHKNSPR